MWKSRSIVGELRSRSSGLGATQVGDDLRCELERALPSAPLVEQAEHATLLKTGCDQVKGWTGIAVAGSCIRDGNTVDEVCAEHLVLDLDFVHGQKERLAATEERRRHQFGVWMEQAGSFQRVLASR
jgi:hypothetical protein